jgi:tetratricopeptide (TPR) repeat protein
MRRVVGFLLFVLLCSGQLQGSSVVRTALVFPFENQSSRADLNWISESFAEVISTRLAQPDNYLLDRDERNAAYTQLGIPIDTPLTLASEFKVAQTLGVDWAILGSFQVTDNRLEARAQFLDVRHLKLSPPLEVSGDLTDLVDVQTQIAWRLLAEHDGSFTVGKEEDFRRRFHDIRLDAFENYIRGLLATEDTSRLHFFQESDRLDPSDHHAAFALGRFYFEQKDYANSALWLRKLGEPDPDYDESLFLRAVDEFFLGHEQTAEKEFESLWKELPLDEVANNLGVLEARRGRYAEALAYFERAYGSDPSDADFCFNRGVALWYEKRYQDAAESLRQAVHANEDDFEAHMLLSVILGRVGDAAAEKQELNWLTEHDVGIAAEHPIEVLPQPRIKKNYNGRAFRLLELTFHNALERRLANASPQEHSSAHLALGKKFFEEKRYAEAEREISEAVSWAPADPQGHVLLAQTLEAEGKHQEAAAELQASLKLKDTVEAHLSLARVYLSLNQPALARSQGQAALDLDPRNREAEQLVEQIHGGAAAPRKTP